MEWVAGPASYDWQWLNYYSHLYKNDIKEGFHDFLISLSDIGYSARCSSEVEKFFWKTKKIEDPKQKEQMKDEFAGDAKHTHKPHEDARREGRIFFGMHKALGISP